MIAAKKFQSPNLIFVFDYDSNIFNFLNRERNNKKKHFPFQGSAYIF